MAEKRRFRRVMVFAKNLGFGVGFGYRNNTITKSPLFCLTRTMLATEQLNVKLFWFSTCSVHDSRSVHLYTKFLGSG